jgi:uncharacterized membrane protein YfcA
MSTAIIIALCGTGFVAAIVGAIAGGNSLITVPVMMFFGLDAHSAVATNMVGVAALSIGAAARFAKTEYVPKHPTLALTLMAVPGSLAGALLAANISETALRITVAVSMLALAAFLLFQRQFGAQRRTPRTNVVVIGYAFASAWAVYGGLYSGGYTTVLTVACTFFFGITLLESVAVTKFVNAASSIAAAVIFWNQNLIRHDLVVPFAAATLVGGFVGAHLATRLGNRWIRRVIIIAVVVMAVILIVESTVRS